MRCRQRLGLRSVSMILPPTPASRTALAGRSDSGRETDRSVVGPLVALAAPMLLGQAGLVLLQLTDTLMLGHGEHGGTVPLAGAALAGNFVLFAIYFAYGSIGAVAPRIAQAFGAGDDRGVGIAARAGVALGLLVGLLIAVALTAITPFLGALGQPPEVVRVSGSYLLLVAWSMPAALLTLVLGQTAESINKPWPVVAVMVGAVALNAGLNWLLIFGNLGCPAMGLQGAGWATLASRWLQAAVLLAWLCQSRHTQRYRFWSVDGGLWSMVRDLFGQGLPVAAQDVLEGGSFAAGSLMLGWVGTTAMAANQVTLGIASLAWMFPISLSMATSIRVAHAVGAGDMPTARRTGIAAILLGATLMAACAMVYTTSGLWLARLFTNDDAVAELAGTLVTIVGIYQISDAIQSVSLGALRGLVDNRVPMIANAICYWLLSIPTVYLLAFTAGWGAAGVWLGYLPWMILTGLFFLWRFLKITSTP